MRKAPWLFLPLPLQLLHKISLSDLLQVIEKNERLGWIGKEDWTVDDKPPGEKQQLRRSLLECKVWWGITEVLSVDIMVENCITNSITSLFYIGNRIILVLFVNYWRCWVWTGYYWFHFPKNLSNKMTKCCLQSQTILSLGNSRASELCARLWTEGSVWYVVFHSVSREDRKNY